MYEGICIQWHGFKQLGHDEYEQKENGMIK